MDTRNKIKKPTSGLKSKVRGGKVRGLCLGTCMPLELRPSEALSTRNVTGVVTDTLGIGEICLEAAFRVYMAEPRVGPNRTK